jgi:hypothetical protein
VEPHQDGAVVFKSAAQTQQRFFELGGTGQPEVPVSGGAQTVASVGPAIHARRSEQKLDDGRRGMRLVNWRQTPGINKKAR